MKVELEVMKRSLYSYALPLLLLTACATPEAPADQPSPLKAIALDSSVAIVTGQTVYVPIYSHIYIWERSRTLDLTATLSVRNTDPKHSIILTAVDYYDNNGKLIRNYLAQPVELGSMVATDFLVNQNDTRGGAGASFVVEWVAQQQVTPPVIEAVMVNAGGNQGISFVSPGRVIQTRSSNE